VPPLPRVRGPRARGSKSFRDVGPKLLVLLEENGELEEQALPSARRGPTGREIELYGEAGELCRTRVARVATLARAIPHFGQRQQWSGELGDPPAPKSVIARDLVDLSASAGSYLALELSPNPSCAKARWARAADQTAPPLLARRAAKAAETSAALAAFERLPIHATKQKAFELEAASKQEMPWYRFGDARSTLTVFEASGGKWIAVSAEAGHACGEFRAEGWALFKDKSGELELESHESFQRTYFYADCCLRCRRRRQPRAAREVICGFCRFAADGTRSCSTPLRSISIADADAQPVPYASWHAPCSYLEGSIVEPPSTVLIVDDNPANLLAMRALFAADNQVITASSGEEAIAVLRQRQDIDIVLMDVQMPGMDGFEAAARIKELPGRDDVPIIFVSAVYTEDPSIKKGYEVGGIDYLTKPFDPELLKRKVAVYAAFRRRSAFLRQRELLLRESKELASTGRKLAILRCNLPLGVLLVEANGRIAHATEPVLGILGIPGAKDAYRQLLNWWEVGGRPLREQLSPLARALEASESTRNKRVQFTGADGAPKTILVAAAPLDPGGPKRSGAALLLQDISELEGLEDALEEQVSRLVSLGSELTSTAL
jgi:CheY-like chemotaxis protein